MIRITLIKDSYVAHNGKVVPARTQVETFEDHETAANWLIEDSYFSEPYTRMVLWQRLP